MTNLVRCHFCIGQRESLPMLQRQKGILKPAKQRARASAIEEYHPNIRLLRAHDKRVESPLWAKEVGLRFARPAVFGGKCSP